MLCNVDDDMIQILVTVTSGMLQKPIEDWLLLVVILCSYAKLEIYSCGGSRAWSEASSPEMDNELGFIGALLQGLGGLLI